MLVIRSWSELNEVLEDIAAAAQAGDNPERTAERIAEATAAMRKWASLSPEQRAATEKFLGEEPVNLVTGEPLPSF